MLFQLREPAQDFSYSGVVLATTAKLSMAVMSGVPPFRKSRRELHAGEALSPREYMKL